MLQDIRDNSQGVIAKVIIGLIVAIFALFGVESIIGGFVTSPPVAEVNGEEITEAQLQFSTQNLLGSLGGNLESLDQNLIEQIALGQLIEETVLRQSVVNSSMSVSSNRVDRSIVETQSFQVNGTFDSDLAVRTMASQGFNVPGYRQALQQQMLLSQLANAYSNSNFVTESELNLMAELSAQSRDFRYLSITMGTRTLGTAISDAQIQTYYDEHQDDFVEAESVVVKYVLLDQNAIAEEIEVDETQLLAQYEVEQSSYEGSAEKRASHILFEVGRDLTEEQALELAATAKTRLDAGEDFGVVALEVSTDTISAEDGGDIGYSDGSAFPTAIEQALEILELNEISEPVISEFGVHIVMLTEDAENVFQPFEEVRDRISRELKSSEVSLIYAARLEDLSNLAFESADLSALATELNLVILESEPVARTGNGGIFSNPTLVGAAFSDDVLLDGNNSELIELSNTQSAVLRVQEFNEASILPLSEVEPEIAVLLRSEMERDAVQTLGDEILTALENGDLGEELLSANELEWIEATQIRRSAFDVNREILEEVFSLSSPAGTPERTSLTLGNSTFVIAELTQVNQGSLESMEEEERTAMTSALLGGLGNSDFQAYIENLKQTADIKQNERAELF